MFSSRISGLSESVLEAFGMTMAQEGGAPETFVIIWLVTYVLVLGDSGTVRVSTQNS